MNKASTTRDKKTFYFVAIGASAGGLEAATELLQNLPSNTGMAFIYVQHLSPDYKSVLTSLLSRSTQMNVVQAANDMRVMPDHFYVIPPNKEMLITDGRIKLTPRKKGPRGNYPIDTFFTSLAEKHNEEAIGIVLSGTATDGTEGLKAIKQAGGLTFAQDESAKFQSMPQSAIAEGVVDFVLSPKEIARELTRLSKHFVGKKSLVQPGDEDALANNNPDLKFIFELLNKETGVDFNYYKMNTIKRRILRRMLLYDLKSVGEYAKLLGKDNNEVQILYQDLLINVTGFFRDTDAYRFLKSTLFPKLLKSKEKGEYIRIWVPACSTGEEAYSIGMMLLEMQETNPGIAIQIFATDLSEKAINKARLGEYSAKEVESVSPVYLKRFYTKVNDHYRIAKALRDIIVFAPHNILHDPPFSRLDFISCCNLLIYFDAEAQKKALATFHYALNEDGYLMLGNSETVGASQRLFTSVNKKIKIYQRKKNTGPGMLPDLAPHFIRQPQRDENKLALPPKKTTLSANGLSGIIDSVIYNQYMPSCVVINNDLEIVQFRGSTDFYLTHAPGKASLNILKMIRPELAFELRSAIQKTFKTKQPVRRKNIEIGIGNELQLIGFEVVPLKIEWQEPLYLILFDKYKVEEEFLQAGKGSKGSVAQKDKKIKKLQEEVVAYRAELHALVENQENVIEKLQSANEEIVSNNEELQTLNEELGTSKEEIQSSNEELITINQELQTRNELLTELHRYSEAIIDTIHDSLIVLDKDMRVKNANRMFYNKFLLKERDVEGHRLFELNNGQWNNTELRSQLENIVSKNAVFSNYEINISLPGIGEKIMLLNASRIVQQNKSEPLILLAIADITEWTHLESKKKELEQAISEKTDELRTANESLQQRNDDLVKMNKELESFAYISSHDLQEPLRIIRSFANLILQKEVEHLSETGKDYFNRIQTSIARMQKLIEDLLTYSRASIKDKKLERTDLGKVVEDVKTVLRKNIVEKNAVIETGPLNEINGISFQLRQLMQNLVSNSLKFSKPDRPPHIVIKSEIAKGIDLHIKNLAPQREYCHIIFSDNGIGFEQHFSERIFQVFQRLHHREEYSGTGIGLAVVKKIVENHEGVITATSEVDKGAKFDIYIPLN